LGTSPPGHPLVRRIGDLRSRDLKTPIGVIRRRAFNQLSTREKRMNAIPKPAPTPTALRHPSARRPNVTHVSIDAGPAPHRVCEHPAPCSASRAPHRRRHREPLARLRRPSRRRCSTYDVCNTPRTLLATCPSVTSPTSTTWPTLRSIVQRGRLGHSCWVDGRLMGYTTWPRRGRGAMTISPAEGTHTA